MLGIEGSIGLNRFDQEASPRRLRNAAQEFEGQMMKEILMPLTEDMAKEGSDDTGMGANGALTEFATESLGRALSTHGGLGIAKEVLKSVSQSRNLP